MNTRAPGPGPDALDPVPDAPVLAAFSGGLDSTVLLHWLAARDDVRARGLRAVVEDRVLLAGNKTVIFR